jgi:choline dehydrogenase-like flavoprotein
VVDLELEGYGCQGLRIADADAFRRTLATTNAPCIMVGEKCADIIAKEKPMGLTT